MVLPTSEYKYLQNWYKIYERTRDAGQLSTYTDLPYDVVLQEKWLDVTSPTLRYFPVNYQDFWICADVNTTYHYAYGERNNIWTKYKNPWLSHQPQPYTYYYDLTYTTSNPRCDAGWYIHLDRTTSGGFLRSYYDFLSCATDTPGMLAQIPTSNIKFIKKGGTNGSTGTAGWPEYAWERISADNGVPNIITGKYDIWTAVSSVPVSSEYALSGPSFTQDLSVHLSSTPHKVICYLDYYSEHYSYDDEAQIGSIHINQNHKYNFGDMISTGGKLKEHDFHRASPLSAWIERWGGSGDYEFNSESEVQRMRWETSTQLSVQFCDYKSFYPPKNNETGKCYRIYIWGPTFCYYSNLSADLYQTWNVNFGDYSTWWWRKLPLTFECTTIDIPGLGLCPRKAMRSKEVFTFEELFCLWSPFDENDAKTKIASMRNEAGLSAWAFTDAPIVNQNNQHLYRHLAVVQSNVPYMVWKFNHPLEMPPNYHFPNQDTSS